MRQLVEGPLAAFDIMLLRHGQLEEMTHRRRDDVIVIFKEVLALVALRLQDLGNISGY